MKDSSKLVGQGGCKRVAAGQTYNGEVYMIMVMEDATVISTLTRTKRDGNTEDALVETNLGAVAMLAGSPPITPINTLFTTVSVSAGSVMVYFG